MTKTEFDCAIESAAAEEYRPGVSAGAAARQLCRTLGCMGYAPELKRMIEDVLADANRASHDRHMIIEAFRAVDPEAARAAAHASFVRTNEPPSSMVEKN